MQTLSLSQSQRQTISQQLVLAQQAYAARLIEMSDLGHEAWIAEQLRDNPALRRRAMPPRLNDTSTSSPAPSSGDDIPYDYSWTDAKDLTAHLLDQLRLQRCSEDEARAAVAIIQNLDRFGLLLATKEQIAEMAEVDEDAVEDGQALVMGLEPEGCGADDLQGYIDFMVRQLFKADEKRMLLRIVGTYFDELRAKNYARIAKLEQREVAEIERFAAAIATIPPFPAQGFAEEDLSAHIIPTVFVTRTENDEVSVDVQDPPRSRIEMNQKWVDTFKSMPAGKEKTAMRAQFESAEAVLRQVETRYSLLARVAHLAIRRQRSYFLYGDEYMTNLTMEQVAQELSEKRPNISRTVKERYYQYNGEIRPLRELFSHRGAGNRPSKNKLHAVLREIVDAEDPRSPLSDAAIADVLKARGIHEARRTVAKHRELAGIPAVHVRRKAKAK